MFSIFPFKELNKKSFWDVRIKPYGEKTFCIYVRFLVTTYHRRWWKTYKKTHYHVNSYLSKQHDLQSFPHCFGKKGKAEFAYKVFKNKGGF